MTAGLPFRGSDTDQIIPALVKALSAMDDIPRTESVSAGPMRYKFAPLNVVLDAVRPHLRANGLAISQIPTTAEGVHTIIWHESGQVLHFDPLLIHPAGATPQNVGSTITYARRYAMMSILGLATEDDDGAAGSVSATPPPAENPLTGRIDAALHRMTLLPEAAKVKMREWSNAEGRKLSGGAMLNDVEWLSQIESWLDVNEEDDVSEPIEEPF